MTSCISLSTLPGYSETQARLSCYGVYKETELLSPQKVEFLCITAREKSETKLLARRVIVKNNIEIYFKGLLLLFLTVQPKLPFTTWIFSDIITCSDTTQCIVEVLKHETLSIG